MTKCVQTKNLIQSIQIYGLNVYKNKLNDLKKTIKIESVQTENFITLFPFIKTKVDVKKNIT